MTYRTGASLSSDEEQEKLRAYRAAGIGGRDLTDANTLEDAAFQNWSGGGAQQSGGSAAMTGLAAAAPGTPASDMSQTALSSVPVVGAAGGGAPATVTSPSADSGAASLFKGFGSSVGSAVSELGAAAPQGMPPSAFGSSYRPNLGQRIYGNESSPLAGLRRVY